MNVLKKIQEFGLVLFATALFCQSARAGASPDPASALEKATLVYQTSAVILTATEKELSSPWKSDHEKSLGKLYLTKGKFRWETEGSEKVWAIFNGKTLWSVRFASPDFPGKNHVLRMKYNKGEKEKFFLLQLLDSKDLKKDFQISSVDAQTYSLTPKSGSAGFKDIRIKISQNFVTEVAYKDDVDNLTKIHFEKPQLNVKKQADFFTYKPNPKNDEVEDK